MADALRDAVARSEGDSVVTHHAFALAAALGTARPKRSTKNALVASVMLLQRPPRYRTLEEAARAHKASVSNLRSWRQVLTNALEAEAHARAASRASTSRTDALGGALESMLERPSARPRQRDRQRQDEDGRRPEEVSAAQGLLNMGAEKD